MMPSVLWCAVLHDFARLLAVGGMLPNSRSTKFFSIVEAIRRKCGVTDGVDIIFTHQVRAF
jgi:hypothetical protein